MGDGSMRSREQKSLGSGLAAKSEPADILGGVSLTGKVAVVTGGYSGIGLETTRALAAGGVRVYVPARDQGRAEAALTGVEGDVVVAKMDLAELSGVARFASDVANAESRIDLLINNAGVMACPEARLGKGWESQFAINHLGHFCLTECLLDRLLAAEAPRVVSLSSTAHKLSPIRWDDMHFERDTYDKWVAYGQAKTANALFARGLDIRCEANGLQAFSVHPGGILTPLQRHLEIEEMQARGWTDETGQLTEAAAQIFKTPSQGCTTTLWAATSPLLANVGGVYCEDCDVANASDPDQPGFTGVDAWAADDEAALRLWNVTEQMLSG